MTSWDLKLERCCVGWDIFHIFCNSTSSLVDTWNLLNWMERLILTTHLWMFFVLATGPSLQAGLPLQEPGAWTRDLPMDGRWRQTEMGETTSSSEWMSSTNKLPFKSKHASEMCAGFKYFNQEGISMILWSCVQRVRIHLNLLNLHPKIRIQI